MTPPGLRPPPPTGSSALAPGTYDGSVVVVTGGGTGLGKAIATEFGRLGASVAILSRDEEHRAGRCRGGRGGRGDRLRHPVRHPGCRLHRHRLRRRRADLRSHRRAGQQRGGQLSGAGRGHEPQRLAHGGGHRAQRHLPVLPGPGPATDPGRAGRGHRERGGLLRLDGWPGVRPLRRGQGRGQEPDRDPGRRVGPLRNPGQRPGPRTHAPRGRGGRHRRGARQVRGPGLTGAGRPGGLPPGAGLGCHLPVLSLRRLHQRPLAGGGRGQLAAPPHRPAALHPDPRAARPPAVRREQAPRKEPPHEHPEPGRPAAGDVWRWTATSP